METKYTNIRPENEGDQYSVVWIYNGAIWSDCIKIIDGKHIVFNNKTDEWEGKKGKKRETVFTPGGTQDLVTYITDAKST